MNSSSYLLLLLFKQSNLFDLLILSEPALVEQNI